MDVCDREGRLTEAGQQLVVSGLGYAYLAATRYWRRNAGFDLDELRAEALYGLCYAAVRFDPSKGIAFGTFLKKVLYQRIHSGACRILARGFGALANNLLMKRTGFDAVPEVETGMDTQETIEWKDNWAMDRHPEVDLCDLWTLQDALAGLKAEARDLVWDHVVEGRTIKELAAERGWRVMVTSRRIRIQIQKLERCLS